MKTINGAIEEVLAAEGGYVNDANDRGGETNFGITVAVARQQGYAGQMRDMPRDFAREVYMRQYVVAPGFDKIGALSMSVAYELVDTGVNMGPTVAAKFLQRAMTVLGHPLLQDGQAGAATRAALDAFMKKRGAEGERRLVALLNAFQGERYAALVEGRPQNGAFMFGWLARIAA